VGDDVVEPRRREGGQVVRGERDLPVEGFDPPLQDGVRPRV
jgi:hypothetical protein